MIDPLIKPPVSFTVSQLAEIFSTRIYDPTERWDVLLTGPRYGNCHVGLLIDHAAGVVLCALRGTTIGLDYLKDLVAALPDDAGAIGVVPLGFSLGMAAVADKLLEILHPGDALFLGGHSLGASEASILAGLLIARGLMPSGLVLMGCPKPGGPTLSHLLLQVPQYFSFWNGDDPVPDLPPWAEHCREPTALHEPPPTLTTLTGLADWHDLPLIGWHDSSLYLRGIAKRDLPLIIAAPAARSFTMSDTPVTVAATPAPESWVQRTIDRIKADLALLFAASGPVQTDIKTVSGNIAAAAPALATDAELAEALSGNAELVPVTQAATGALVAGNAVLQAGSVQAALVNAHAAVTAVESAVAAGKAA